MASDSSPPVRSHLRLRPFFGIEFGIGVRSTHWIVRIGFDVTRKEHLNRNDGSASPVAGLGGAVMSSRLVSNNWTLGRQ